MRRLPLILPCTWFAHVSGLSAASQAAWETCCLMGPTSSPPGVRLQLKDSAPAPGTQHCLREVTQAPDWGGGAIESPMVATHPDHIPQTQKLTSRPAA